MRLSLLLICILLHFESPAQDAAIGSWREYLPYLHGNKVQTAGPRIFCVTDESLFSVNPSDQAIERHSKLNGLNDFGITSLNYSDQFHKLMICYSDANIDLLDDNDKVVNLSDIKRKNILGNKSINSVYMDGSLAYLACGFGIVVMDIDREEIRETWYIGANGSPVNVYAVTSDANTFYAAAENGIYIASKTAANLADFNNWSLLYTASGKFNDAVVINSILLVNFRRTANPDTLLSWQNLVPYSLPSSINAFTNINSLKLNSNRVLLTTTDAVSEFDANFNLVKQLTVADIPGLKASDASMTVEGSYWIADREKGMIHYQDGQVQKYIPAGPNSAAVSAMETVNGRLWVMHAPKDRGWNNAYTYAGFSTYHDGSWITYDGYTSNTPLFSRYNFFDNMSLTVDQSDDEHLFIGSGGSGLLEFSHGQPAAFYRDTNSTLRQQIGNPGQVKVHGIRYDDQANLWTTNAGVLTVLDVREPNGKWTAYNFPGKVNNSAKTGELVIDQNGYKWFTVFENIGSQDGILVVNDNGTVDNTTDDESWLVDFGSNRVRSLAVDKEGTIWAGMETGLNVFYPPSVEPQKIIIKQDNSFQYLLETESITCIAVDGANRKWVGTEASGVYLFSPDGQEQVKHFTAENSPLFANNIQAITIDGKSGEVFIGTAEGLISYQGDAIEGTTDCNKPVVYPNPVSSAYNGPVAVKGIPENSTMKITDVAGNLVYESASLGGQAVWTGNDLHGTRVSTGVYLVFTVGADGTNSCRTKLMFYH